MHLATLSQALRNDIAYPPQVEFIETGILGLGFYPGCKGFAGDQAVGGIMLLGRDFGTKSYYQKLVGAPARDETALTWRHTRDIFLSELSGIPVWCTNYLMGVRVDGSATGNLKERIAPADWLKYETSCWKFLHKQVNLQKPQIIVVLGRDNRSDLLAEERFGPLRGTPLKYTVKQATTSDEAIVVFADHPHSLIRHSAKAVAKAEIRRIRNLLD